MTRTPSPTVPPEPVVTFFGLADATNAVIPVSGMTQEGYPRFDLSFGFNFYVVIEGRPGGTHAALGLSAFNWNPTDPTVLPDLQIEVSQALGDNPTAAVCDNSPGNFGGVPAIDPPDFSPLQSVADAINDFACRFSNETGAPGGRTMNPCIVLGDGTPAFGDPHSTAEFCGLMDKPFKFEPGLTVVTARLRDVAGHVSAQAHIGICINGPCGQ